MPRADAPEMLATPLERLRRPGCIGIAMTNASPEMATWGGASEVVGTNPGGKGVMHRYGRESRRMSLDRFKTRMDRIIDMIKASRRRPGFDEIYVPGEIAPERRRGERANA